jgi:nucleotide-binding universal stress UspA family protein
VGRINVLAFTEIRSTLMTATFVRILVPVDFSTHSEMAVRYATALAKQSGGSVELLHVLEHPVMSDVWSSEVYVPDLPEIRERLVADAEARLATYRESIRNEGVPTMTTVRSGQAAHVIVEYGTAAGSDLVVMGTHGRTGLPHLFMGSIAERVVRTAPCPILTVRATAGKVESQQAAAAGAA